MRIGYACKTLGVEGVKLKSCTKKNADETNLYQIIEQNLEAFHRVLDYLIAQKISMFRISSDLIPFGSSPVNALLWDKLFEETFTAIGERIKAHNIRVSMHPGQYTVLNSPKEDVVRRAILDLEYHATVMDALKLDTTHKMVLHIGGVYEDKTNAMKRFVQNYHTLPEAVKRRLILENDDKLYHIEDVLTLARQIQAPVVYDNLHNQIHCSDRTVKDSEWIAEVKKTWTKKDGKPKVHYSQQAIGKRPGSHSATIQIEEFMRYYESIQKQNVDIMLEVKDKNLSAVKCINCISEYCETKVLEEEWKRYQYVVLEQSPKAYQKINNGFGKKETYNVKDFYQNIEQALQEEGDKHTRIHAAKYIWDSIREDVTEKEEIQFLQKIEAYHNGTSKDTAIKNYIWKIANKYKRMDFKQSLYFYYPW